jgi:hypothetical protein
MRVYHPRIPGVSRPGCSLPSLVRNGLDFSSWQALLSTLLGVAVFSLVVVGIRLLVMHTVQLRRERENRQINERLRTLIAAYKVLGGSFTGDLAVDPAHRRDRFDMPSTAAEASADIDAGASASVPDATASASTARSTASHDAAQGSDPASAVRASEAPGAERRRRIRDAVEAALSDVILLGTEEQVRLAAQAARDMTQGRPVETAELVVSLRNFIRDVLDLEAVPVDVAVPRQGPARPGATGGRGRGEGGREERGQGAGGGRAGGQGGGGAGMAGLGFGAGRMHDAGDVDSPPHP